MFKKKTSLPARPPIPNKDDILNDINHALADDVVFKNMQENAADLTGEADGEASSTSEKRDNSDSLENRGHSQDYLLITKYVEKLENLINYDREIRNGRDGLQYLTKDLIEDMAKAREENERYMAVQMAKFKPEDIFKHSN